MLKDYNECIYYIFLQVYSVNLRFIIVNSKSIYKYKHAYENGYDEYMVTYSYM